jgi:hypothetical protein
VAQRTWAAVITQLTDELNGNAPDGAIRMKCDNPNFTARAGSGGFAGLAAIPARAMPLLTSQNYPVELSVAVEGYVADSQAVMILADASFPGSFTPLDIGVWPLHRDPLSIYGSVSLATASGPAAVAGASVALTKLWRLVGTAPAALDALTLNTTLGAARPAGANVQKFSMTLAGTPYQLQKETAPGSNAVLLSNTISLGVGSVVGFDLGDPDRAEYATVVGISGSVSPTQPATAVLALPLSSLHASLIPVQRVTPAATGPVNAIGVGAIAGDRVLLMNSPVAGIASGDVVAISGGVPTIEYQFVSVFAVTSDALGNYRLPLLSRVAELELTANDGVHAPVAQLVIPQYGNRDNRVDFLLH